MVNDVIRLQNGVTESTITKVGKDINVLDGGRQPGRKRSFISYYCW